MDGSVIESNVAARLDRLPWSGWHWMVITALGITWLLDGLEVTLAGALVGILKDPRSLGFTDQQIGLTATAYLAGAVTGALVFGHATDRLGRKKLFFFTLALYLSATAATACAGNFWSFVVFRALTGAGIGGEYAAINSAIDELIPARVRGRVDLVINSTFWVGAALGSVTAMALVHLPSISPLRSWRYAFGVGAVLGMGVLFMRRFVPESPRWLLIHGGKKEAESIVDEIERKAVGDPSRLPKAEGTIKLHVRHYTPWKEIWTAMAYTYRKRSLLGFALMVAQAFFYNAVLFTYGLILLRFYQVSPESISLYLLPLALGNFLGPLLVGHLFDTIGRRIMITATYVISGVLLAGSTWLFAHDLLNAHTQAIAWSVIFFVASSAASSAYLTVSEVFPLEIRALAIAIFFACGTLLGGVGAPTLFGYLTSTGSRVLLSWGYIAASALMIGAGLVEYFWGVAAERKPLEAITDPLSRCA
jgi:MFS family permease